MYNALTRLRAPNMPHNALAAADNGADILPAMSAQMLQICAHHGLVCGTYAPYEQLIACITAAD